MNSTSSCGTCLPKIRIVTMLSLLCAAGVDNDSDDEYEVEGELFDPSEKGGDDKAHLNAGTNHTIVGLQKPRTRTHTHTTFVVLQEMVKCYDCTSSAPPPSEQERFEGDVWGVAWEVCTL